MIKIEDIVVRGYKWRGKIYKDQENMDDTSFYEVYGIVDATKTAGEWRATASTIDFEGENYDAKGDFAALARLITSVDIDALNREIEKQFDYANTVENYKHVDVNDPRN